MNNQLAGTWRTSSFTNGNANCVQVNITHDVVGVRDSKDRDRLTLTLPPVSWDALLRLLER